MHKLATFAASTAAAARRSATRTASRLHPFAPLPRFRPAPIHYCTIMHSFLSPRRLHSTAAHAATHTASPSSSSAPHASLSHQHSPSSVSDEELHSLTHPPTTPTTPTASSTADSNSDSTQPASAATAVTEATDSAATRTTHPPRPRRYSPPRSRSAAPAIGESIAGPDGDSSDLLTAEATRPKRFALTKEFVDKWRHVKPPFGYNGLGELVYRRTYSRKKGDDGKDMSGMGGPVPNEQWFETVERVVNGTYNMQKQWIEQHELGWNPHKAQKSAKEMYERIFHMKFLPPGRGLWAMGSPVTEQRRLFAALNNCAFVSTRDIEKDRSKPFCFLMDASMLGVGVGFDTEGGGKLKLKGPSSTSGLPLRTFEIPDSREGWVEALRRLLEAYMSGKELSEYDYSKIRPKGTPIKGFGGEASGPDALKELLRDVRTILDRRLNATSDDERVLSTTDIVDIMNMIGRCVIAGNVRRTAEIAFGSADSLEYLDLKNYAKNPHRADFGWTSNNSVFATLGMDYKEVCNRVRMNGEPGFAWLENMRKYARINGDPAESDERDHRVAGGNPCLEQSLESYELCCLVETFPNNHSDLEDYKRTLKFAYLYAKTVTLGKTHWPETNRVMLRNRRIGCSVSGVAQFISKHGLHTLKNWLEEGYREIQSYDERYSDWFAIPRSIKTTSVKPSGTVSLLAGATPGMHYPSSRFYIRRIRLSDSSELVGPLREANYPIEKASDGGNTLVVEFPIDVGAGVRTEEEVTLWEQLSLAAFLQRYWSDNQVSCTVTFNPETEADQLEAVLDYFQYQLKGISFLPRTKGVYQQMPYEQISEAEYRARLAALKPLDFSAARVSIEEAEPDRFCDADVCSVGGAPSAGLGEAVPVDEQSVDPTVETRQHVHTSQLLAQLKEQQEEERKEAEDTTAQKPSYSEAVVTESKEQPQ